MAWSYLMIAGVFEVVWAIGLKYSQGFTRLYPSLIAFVGIVIRVLLGIVERRIRQQRFALCKNKDIIISIK